MNLFSAHASADSFSPESVPSARFYENIEIPGIDENSIGRKLDEDLPQVLIGNLEILPHEVGVTD